MVPGMAISHFYKSFSHAVDKCRKILSGHWTKCRQNGRSTHTQTLGGFVTVKPFVCQVGLSSGRPELSLLATAHARETGSQ